MDDKIKEAVRLLGENDYIVVKITESMKRYFSECVNFNGGDCSECPCNMCILRSK